FNAKTIEPSERMRSRGCHARTGLCSFRPSVITVSVPGQSRWRFDAHTERPSEIGHAVAPSDGAVRGIPKTLEFGMECSRRHDLRTPAAWPLSMPLNNSQ